MSDDKHSQFFTLHSPLVPLGYKQTEVGVIPEDWEVASLSSVSKEPMQNGVFYTPSLKGVGVKLINVGDLYTRTPIDSDTLKLFDATDKERERFKVEDGDLFFTRSSVVPSGIAHCNIYRALEPEPVVFDSHIIRLRPDTKKGVPSYLFKYCIASVARHYWVSHAKTATMTTIAQGVLGKCPVILPPFAEPETIAKALSDADTFTESLEQLIAKKCQIKQGAMQALRCPKNGWVEDEIHSILMLIMDYRGRTPKKLGMEWGSGDIRDLSAGNVKMGRIDLEAEAYFGSEQLHQKWMTQGETHKDDILITTEAPLGNVALIPENKKYILSQRVMLLRVDPRRLDSHFLFHLLSSNQFQNLLKKDSSGSTATGIQRLKFEKITVFYPSLLAEQTSIAPILSDMDTEVAALEAKLAKARQIKQGMMQELLTGKTRLVESGKLKVESEK